MNLLRGTITEIKVHGNLSLVRVSVSNITLTSIVIETPETVAYLKIGKEVKVMFKETEVIIGTAQDPGISLQNQIPVAIKEVVPGVLLSELLLEFNGKMIRSVITSRAVEQLGLTAGDRVTAMVKTNEVMLAE